MNPIHRRVAIAYNDADPKPDVITLSRLQWYEMYDGYTETVKKQYLVNGFYKIGRRKQGKLRRSYPAGQPSVDAFTYKAIPVVAREDYDDMMRGHRSRRNVLAV